MITPELIQFVKSEMTKGISKDSITALLKTQGWTDLDISEAFNTVSASSPSTSSAPSLNNAPVLNNTNPASNSWESKDQVSSPTVEAGPTMTDDPNPTMTASPAMGTSSFTGMPASGTSFNPSMNSGANMMAEMGMEEPRKSKKFLWIFLILLILILGGAFTYTMGYFTPLDKMPSNYLRSSSSVTTADFDLSMNVDLSKMKNIEDMVDMLGESSKNMVLTMKGKYDMADKVNSKSESSFLMTLGSMTLGFDIKYLGDTVYMNMTKAPNPGFISLSPFENKWIHFSKADVSKDIMNNPLVDTSNLPSNSLDKLTDAQKQELINITQNANLITITKRHLPEMIDGTLAYHFNFEVNKPGVVIYLKQVYDFLKVNKLTEEEMTDADIATFETKLNAITINGEAWVGILDNTPRKGTLAINAKDEDTGELNMDVTYIISNINKPVEIVAPTDSQSLEEFMNSVGIMMSGDLNIGITDTTDSSKVTETFPIDNNASRDLGLKGNDLLMKNILDGIAKDAELFYSQNKTYFGFCSSKKEVGAYHLAITLPKNTTYKCNDSNMSFATWAKLSSGDYFCADSTGSSGLIKSPKGTECLMNN